MLDLLEAIKNRITALAKSGFTGTFSFEVTLSQGGVVKAYFTQTDKIK